MMYLKRRPDCPTPTEALPRRFSLRHWVAVMSILMITRSKNIDAATYIVSPEANGGHITLSEAMELVGPGDVVQLEDGTYRDRLESLTSGEEGSPITFIGSEGATINTDRSPSVLITHSYIHLVGFSVNGLHGSGDSADSWVNKCVWVEGKVEDDLVTPIEGFVMRDMSIQDCGSECVRLKNFVTGATISNNIIKTCGIYDYEFGDGEKNGEGVYIGTADNQWTYGEDVCDLNYVSGNIIETNGNECVDIKEGSTKNVIERNTCSKQLDENSGCFSSRGDANTFRFNMMSDCLGAGVRLGGDEVDGYKFGSSNNVYGNEITNAEYGSVKVETDSQGLICDNICKDGACEIRGDYGESVEATCFAVCHAETLSTLLQEEPILHTDSTPSPFSESLTKEPSPSPTIFNNDDNRSITPTPSPSAESVTGEPSPSPTIFDDDDSIVDDDNRPITPTPSPSAESVTEEPSPSPTIFDDDDGDGDNGDHDGGDDNGDDDGDDDNDDYDDDDGSYSFSFNLQ